MPRHDNWPALDYQAWQETCSALHLWTQILGKYRVATSPWLNHAWHCVLYVTPSGLTTGPFGNGLSFNLILNGEPKLALATLTGETHARRLSAMSTAEFYALTQDLLHAAGESIDIVAIPNELPDATPFAQDQRQRPCDREALARYHRALYSIQAVFTRFRSAYIGKCSPVHLFWGALDLAVTRFSGRTAPRHPGGIPNLPDAITREAYSHEVSSAGFWPGGGGVEEAMFYAYAYPTNAAFAKAKVVPETAYFDANLGEYLLRYDDVARSASPESTLMAFLDSTYQATVTALEWPNSGLTRPPGPIGHPPAVD